MQPILFKLIRRDRPLGKLGVPPLLLGRLPFFPISYEITGVTKDSTGAALGGCTVKVYRTTDDVLVGTQVSDAAGNYNIQVAASSLAYYVVAYLAGSPDVSGTTVNTLVAS